MALLRHPNTTPPGGWWYFQAETKLKIIGESLDDLTRQVCQHRKYKGIEPIEDIEVSREIQRQVCSRMDDGHCHREGASDPWVPVQPVGELFDLNKIVGASRVALDWVKGGAETVPEAEAERRRSICADCALNQSVVGCKCSVFYKMVEAAVPASKRFDELNVCGVCACSLKAKVWLPEKIIQDENDRRGLHYPVWCWQRLHAHSKT